MESRWGGSSVVIAESEYRHVTFGLVFESGVLIAW